MWLEAVWMWATGWLRATTPATPQVADFKAVEEMWQRMSADLREDVRAIKTEMRDVHEELAACRLRDAQKDRKIARQEGEIEALQEQNADQQKQIEALKGEVRKLKGE